MTTYQNLSPCVYEPTDPSVTTLNVGWLGRASRFGTGSVDNDVRAALVVTAKMSFGIVLRLDDVPDVASVVDAVSYRPRGSLLDRDELPEPGTRVRGVVVDHAEHNWQIKVRVGPAAPTAARIVGVRN